MEYLRVPIVQSLAAHSDASTKIPERYIRPEIKYELAVPKNVDEDGDLEIPVIDVSKLLHLESSVQEAARLHLACKEWGFFQLINHKIPGDLIERIKSDMTEFFKLPLEIKNTFRQLPGSIEGYGQMFIVSGEQKLDWGDMFFLKTRPHTERSISIWPTRPLTFRDTLDRYAEEVYLLENFLTVWIGKNLGINPDNLTNMLKDEKQSVRMNYYPPCPQPDQVLGISPHSDNTLLTILLQVNEVQGLQIEKDGTWVSVDPLPGALIVNIGDSLEIISNGIYRSIMHRVLVNREKERMSIATFYATSPDTLIGPHPEIVKHNKPKFSTMKSADVHKLFLSSKLLGKTALEHMRLNN